MSIFGFNTISICIIYWIFFIDFYLESTLSTPSLPPTHLPTNHFRVIYCNIPYSNLIRRGSFDVHVAIFRTSTLFRGPPAAHKFPALFQPNSSHPSPPSSHTEIIVRIVCAFANLHVSDLNPFSGAFVFALGIYRRNLCATEWNRSKCENKSDTCDLLVSLAIFYNKLNGCRFASWSICSFDVDELKSFWYSWILQSNSIRAVSFVPYNRYASKCVWVCVLKWLSVVTGLIIYYRDSFGDDGYPSI